MGIVFSDPQMAFDGGLSYFLEQEENVYVMRVTYPSGVEYHLRKEKDCICYDNCVRKYILKEDHKFRTLEKALKAVNYFKRKGKRLMVKKQKEIENGYSYVKYYYLCSIYQR